MRFPKFWLEELLEFKISNTELIDILNSSGLELDYIKYNSQYRLSNLVLGKILEVYKHTNSNRLNICKVDVGNEVLQIVCGGNNLYAGMLVVCAKIGAIMADGLEIKHSNIRGEDSFGMLASYYELGLAQLTKAKQNIIDASELIDKDCLLGIDLVDKIELNTEIYNISITPNRGDCMSVIGIAREVCAYKAIAYKENRKSNIEYLNNIDLPSSILEYAGFIVEAPDCPRNISFKIKQRLILSGIDIDKSDDLSNMLAYIELETGISIKHYYLESEASNLNIIETDGLVNTIVNNKTISITGIKDLANNKKSKHALIEFIIMDKKIANKMSTINGLIKEMYRLNRGLNSELIPITISTIQKGLNSIGYALKTLYSAKISRSKNIELRLPLAGFSKFTGLYNLNADNIASILSSLGFIVTIDSDELTIIVPAHRHDITSKYDIYEEILRLYGYNNLVSSRPKALTNNIHKKSNYSDKLKQSLIARSYKEVINLSFSNTSIMKGLNCSDFIKINNPISNNLDCMRSYLFPGIIKNISDTLKLSSIERAKIFEIGKAFSTGNKEVLRLSAVCFEEWDAKNNFHKDIRPLDAFDMKEDLEILFHNKLEILKPNLIEDFMSPECSADIYFNGQKLGIIGLLNPRLNKLLFDLNIKPLYLFELDLIADLLSDKTINSSSFNKASLLAIRDLTLIANKEVDYKEVISRIQGFNTEDLIISSKLYDIFDNKDKSKSYSFSLKINTNDEDIINDLISKMLIDLEQSHGLILRPAAI